MVVDEPLIDVQLVPRPVEARSLTPFPAGAGAECVFLGRTRAEVHPEHGALRELSYHAYESMAMAVLRRLAEQAVDDHGCVAVRIHHARGVVPLGEASVLIQTAAPHRDAAFAGCRHCIDQLKKEAPIWKQELWADGTSWSAGHPVTIDPREPRQ